MNDLKRTWTIRVTKEIIEESEGSSKGEGRANTCMVATAIRRQVQTETLRAWSVNVSRDSIMFNMGAEPGKSDQILLFDKDGKKAVKPFTFRLSNPFVREVKPGKKQNKSKHGPKTEKKRSGRCTIRRYHGELLTTKQREMLGI